MDSEFLSSDVVCAIRQALFLPEDTATSIGGQQSVPCPSFTLECLQYILEKDYGSTMTEQQKTAFKIATVLYSMAHAFLFL